MGEELLRMLFQGWAGLLRTLAVGVLAYSALVVVLRVSGKRTLSKMNAFDFVVTVALGSTLASTLLSKGVALAEGCSPSRCSPACSTPSPGPRCAQRR